MNVPGNALAPGIYNFTLRAWRPGAGEANAGLGSWLMEVVEAELPAVTLEVPWAEDEAMSTQKRATVARAALPRGACGASEAKEWRWTLAAENGTVLANLVTLREGQSVVTYEFLGYELTAGGRYFYALLSTEEISLLPSPGSSLSSVNSAVLVSTSRAFRADGPPTGGDTAVDPWEGEAVTTAFVFETSSWNDEEEDLTYSFYAFPSTILQASSLRESFS